MNSQKRIRLVSILIAVVSILLIVTYVMNSATNDIPYSDEKTAGLALAELTLDTSEIQKRAENIFSTVKSEFSQYTGVTSDQTGLDNCAKLLLDELGAVSIKLMNGSNAYSSYGSKTSLLSNEVKALFGQSEPTVSAIYEDSVYGAKVIAIYIPIVAESATVNFNSALLIYKTDGFIDSLFGDTELHRFGEQSQLFCFVSIDGNILYTSEASFNLIDAGDNVYSFINEHLTQSKAYFDGDYVKSSLKNTNQFLTLDYNGVSYVGAFNLVSGMGSNFVAFGFYDPELFTSRTPVTETLFKVAAVIFVVLLILLFIFIYLGFVYNKKNKLHTEELSGECNGIDELRKRANSIIKRNAYSVYAVVRAELSDRTQLSETCGAETVEKLSKFLGAVINRSLTSAECYVSTESGGYIILFKCTTKQSLLERVRLISSVVNSHPIMKENRNVSHLCIGVSTMSKGEELELDTLLEQAETAMQSHIDRKNEYCVLYSESVNSDGKEKNSDLEKTILHAIEKNDIRLFIQPEYNIKNNFIDGTEIFAKWFNPSTGLFCAQDEIIATVNSDDLTITLERYIYVESLKLLKRSVSHDSHISPFSVSVSACNAMASDFCKYYVQQKKKYGVPDNYVTVIFSESDVLNGSAQLTKNINTLKENGILTAVTSADGSASSHKKLHDAGVNTLIFDASLLSAGSVTLLEPMYRSAVSLGLKTVQKGVNNKNDIPELSRMGCEALQGDCYSKEIRMSDYITFVNGDTALQK